MINAEFDNQNKYSFYDQKNELNNLDVKSEDNFIHPN
jgi:hypothetical protein